LQLTQEDNELSVKKQLIEYILIQKLLHFLQDLMFELPAMVSKTRR